LRWSGDIKKFTAITANKKLASDYGIKNLYEFDIEIGGRYSIWSPIILPAQLGSSNFDPIKFKEGGRQVDIDIKENKDFIKFVKTLSFSDIWYNNYGGRHTRAVLTYNWKLRSFPNYVQQLEMESLGKNRNMQLKFKNTGQIIFGGYGPVAQHSYFQLLHQGTQKICADIIVSEEERDLSYAQAITQSKLLSRGAEDLEKENKINGNTPVNLFRLKKIDSYNLGYLIATWEYRTFITASILNINPFDQFGVNAGKIYTKRYLSEKD
jgi:glucose-6-phosphate isomerase